MASVVVVTLVVATVVVTGVVSFPEMVDVASVVVVTVVVVDEESQFVSLIQTSSPGQSVFKPEGQAIALWQLLLTWFMLYPQ